ncbi:MAG: hypothetical protein HYT87_20245 [Nitrospirae bacterium]|nr:hypothetical protein [Nitrospirota bacterium]
MKQNPVARSEADSAPQVEGNLRWMSVGEFRIERRSLVPPSLSGLLNRQPCIYRLLFLDQARMNEAWVGQSRSLGPDLRAFAKGGGAMPKELRSHVLSALRSGRRVWVEVVEPSRLKLHTGNADLKDDDTRALVRQLALLQTAATVKKVLEFGRKGWS